MSKSSTFRYTLKLFYVLSDIKRTFYLIHQLSFQIHTLMPTRSCKRPITKLKNHFCLWRNLTNAHNPRK